MIPGVQLNASNLNFLRYTTPRQNTQKVLCWINFFKLFSCQNCNFQTLFFNIPGSFSEKMYCNCPKFVLLIGISDKNGEKNDVIWSSHFVCFPFWNVSSKQLFFWFRFFFSFINSFEMYITVIYWIFVKHLDDARLMHYVYEMLYLRKSKCPLFRVGKL